MPADTAPRILVCAPQQGALGELRRLLAAGGHDVEGHLLGTPEPERLADYRLVLVEGTDGGAGPLELCRRLRDRLGEAVVPIVYVLGDHGPAARLASFEAGADTYLLRPFAPG